MRSNRPLNILLVVATVVLAVGQLGGSASAANAGTNGASIKLSPLRSDVTLKPGESGSVDVYVTNLTSAPVMYRPIENDFVAKDETGTPSLILDENSYAPSHSLKRYMVPLDTVTIGAKQTATVTVRIAVPASAQAGGYYGALRFAPATSGGQPVDVVSGAASLILLTVPGPTVERLTLTNFDIRQNGSTATNFRTPNNLSLVLRFENKGNIQEGPFGQVNIQKGKKVVYTYNFNQDTPRSVVLPDSARRWEVPLKGLGKFGKYTVSGTFGYGNGTTVNVQKTVWIIPTVYILAALGAIVLIAAVILAFWLVLRSYKRKILHSSRTRY